MFRKNFVIIIAFFVLLLIVTTTMLGKKISNLNITKASLQEAYVELEKNIFQLFISFKIKMGLIFY